MDKIISHFSGAFTPQLRQRSQPLSLDKGCPRFLTGKQNHSLKGESTLSTDRLS